MGAFDVLKQTIDDGYARLMMTNDGLHDDMSKWGEWGELATIVQNSPHPTLTQIAFMSQYEQMRYAPAPSTPLTRAFDLPKLRTPILPTSLHHLAKQVFKHCYDDTVQMVRLLDFIHERGYVVPPTVWLPPKNLLAHLDEMNCESKLPDDYLAWCAWVGGDDGTNAYTELTDETWDDFYPAQRREILRQWRNTDPKSALDLIVKFAPKEPADKRFDLVEVLSVNLSDDDKPFLQSLQKDRSQKVKQLASTYLARLGEFDDKDTLTDELFDELEIGVSGIVFKPTKNNKLRKNRFEKLQKVNLFALAQKFDLSLGEFLLAWDFDGNNKQSGYDDNNHEFFERMVSIISDDELISIVNPLLKIIDKKGYDGYDFYSLIRSRLPLVIRQEYMYKKFVKGEEFNQLLRFMPNGLDLTFGALKVSSSYKKLIATLERWQQKNSGYIENWHMTNEFFALGLLLNQDTAKECLAHLEYMGVIKTDPVLATLHFNALLDK
ncbi:MAG: DUF5691 domain-containing protein [Moraxella sp.]|nr:DUF5691 domain-containing protein [Moraxella sp.]